MKKILLLICAITTISLHAQNLEQTNTYINSVLGEVNSLTISEIILKYGTPDEIFVHVIDNKYSEIKDVEYKVKYLFLEIDLTYIGNSKSYLTGVIRIKKPGIIKKYNIDVGIQKKLLDQILGTIYMKSPAIEFEVENGLIKEIIVYNLE